SEIVGVWESDAQGSPVDRALVLLGLCRPQQAWDELAAVPLGARDAALLGLHRDTFGGGVDAVADCPECHDRVVFALPAEALPPPLADAPVSFRLSPSGYTLECRLPDSRDLAAAAAASDAAGARSLLADRCISVVDGPDVGGKAGSLPAEVIDAAAAEMARQQ